MLKDMSEEKILGSVWNHRKDVFSFKVKIDLAKFMHENGIQQLQLKLNKRMILSQIV